jgi:hypothetical protein
MVFEVELIIISSLKLKMEQCVNFVVNFGQHCIVETMLLLYVSCDKDVHGPNALSKL